MNVKHLVGIIGCLVAFGQPITAQQTLFSELSEASCQKFDSELDRLGWWLENYPPEISVGLITTPDIPNDLKLLQVAAIRNLLQSNNQLDRQKFIVLEVRMLRLLEDIYGTQESFELLYNLFQSEFPNSDLNTQRSIECAFECADDGGGGVGADFLTCIAGQF